MNRKTVSIVSGLIILLITYLASTFLISSNKETYNNNTNITHSVRTIVVKNSTNQISVKVNGNLKSKYQIELISEVQGKLQSPNKDFKTGQNYRKGEVILKLDSKEFLANVKQSRSQLQNLIASILPDIKLDYPESYKQWKDYFKNFNIDNRVKELPKHNSEKEKFYVIGKGLLAQFYKVKSLEERLSKYTIISPFQGTLIDAYASEGSLVLTGQKLGTYINTNIFDLEVAVPAKYGDKLEVGKKVDLESTYKTKHTGKIVRINNSIDNNSQSIRLFIEFNSKELKDGMYSSVNIPLGNIDDSFSLSRSLLINDSFVYYIKNDMTVGLMNVEAAFYDDETVIIKGLEDGIKILKNYIPGVYDGMKVKIVD